MGIKPIETVYNGYRFRSRLEARWAVFFDACEIAWQYEVEGFDVDGIWYLPDFYLPDFDMYAEIKAKDPTEEEYDKADKLKQNGQPVVILEGPPWHCHFWWFTNGNPQLAFVKAFLELLAYRGHLRFGVVAKQARFEYGENGR